ncbi:YegP family protein [Cochleicola gelatinilyticus]|uniref:DUF1508 domain-containing protein n=1 Tax=Cochleicola gelatinilyticus TaxID=1763537 RepID=A0A167HTI3_9FLAO|nr:YegP family protein [Cochleicola gelatinilyticus]OAB78947.1 hypothetical protein ULVI_10245 [Cochleicola gelatinilyticus]
MFELTKNKEKGTFHFVLKAANGQVILTSETYESKMSALNGIASVQKNCADDTKFERKTSRNGKFFFNLKAKNGKIIGSSQLYVGESGLQNGIVSVQKHAVDAETKEL